MSRRPHIARQLAGPLAASLGVVAIERAISTPELHGHPLDPEPRSVLALMVTFLCLAGLFGLANKVRKGWGASGAALAWSIFVLTEAAHVHNASPWLFTLGALPVWGLVQWRPGSAWPLVVAISVLPAALRPAVDPPSEGVGQTRLLLVTIDTIRADVGLHEAVGLPTSEGWATGRAIAPAPWTPPSMASLWLGGDVTEHGAGVEVDGRVSQPHRGWGSAWPASHVHQTLEAVVSNPYLMDRQGFGAGFDAYWHNGLARERHLVLHTLESTVQRTTGQDTHSGETRDARVVAWAVKRLQAATGPDVLWVHLLEPHEYRQRAGSTDPDDLRAAYSAAVQRTAAHLRQLIHASGDAVVVIVGDHGESMGEAGHWGHGRVAAAEVLWVPLAIRPATRWAGETVSLVDVGRWLETMGKSVDAKLQAGPPARIAGVRGRPSDRFAFDPESGRVTPQPGSVEAGPLAPMPSGSVRAALEQLGYVDR